MTENRLYKDTYNTPYQSNGAYILFYKNDRKNSKILFDMGINHLITKSKDRKVSDESILNQLITALEKIVYECKPNGKYIRYKASIDTWKKADYINAMGETFHDTEYCFYTMSNCRYDIETIINNLYDILALIYPYNTLSKKTIFANSSVNYYINKWYE